VTTGRWLPDISLPDALQLCVYDVVDSTNAEAKRLAVGDVASGTFVIAREQDTGRARDGRSWISPPGNLYSTLILRPAVEPATGAQLSFAAALAVYDTVTHLVPGAPALIKWPNDVLVGGRKISGILLESSSTRDGLLEWLVIGVGINVGSYPDHAGVTATSLHALGATDVTVAACLSRYAADITTWVEIWQQEGFAALRDGWLQRCGGVGRDIRVRLAREEFTGRFCDLDPDGALIVELADGEQRRITAGDVFFAE